MGANCREGASPPESIRLLTCRGNDQWELTLIPVPCLPVSSIGTRRAFLWPVHSTTPSTLDTTRPALWVGSHCGLVTTSTAMSNRHGPSNRGRTKNRDGNCGGLQ